MNENYMVILCRGTPGSGKNFLADQILEKYPSGIICCADDFFTLRERDLLDPNIIKETYKFDKNQLGTAHTCCRARFYQGLLEGVSPIIVANTNIRWSDMKEYIEWAACADYEVYLAEPQTPWAKNAEECWRKNQHGVPLDTIKAMLARYQPNSHIIEQGRYNNIEIRIWEGAE
jgi:hypothetical protein